MTMVAAKEAGWVLAMDQASNSAGVSLWYSGQLRATTLLTSDKSTDALPRRLQSMVIQLAAFLDREVPEPDVVRRVIFEGVRSRLVLVTVGAFLTVSRIQARISPKKDFVESTQWKSWARKNGARGDLADIKGVLALRDIGFPVDHYRINSDDIADAVMIYKTWAERRD
jgi:hypothetical protein